MTDTPINLQLDQPQQGKVQTGALADNGTECKLDADASREAALPHLEAGVRIASFNRSTNCIVPDIHDSVPADKDAIKESHELKEGIKDEPLDHDASEGEANEANIQPYQQLVGRILKTDNECQDKNSRSNRGSYLTTT